MAAAHQGSSGCRRRRGGRAPLLLALAVVGGALVGPSQAWVMRPLQQAPFAVGSHISHSHARRRAAASCGPLGGPLGGQQQGRTTLALAAAAADGADAGAGAGATSSASYDVDVAIIGGGPAGSVMAALLAEQHKLKVVLMDPKLEERWIPNYGVWLEEWQGGLWCVWARLVVIVWGLRTYLFACDSLTPHIPLQHHTIQRWSAPWASRWSTAS